MNIVKLLIGIALIALVASYPLMGTLGLAALGLPFPVIIILGIIAVGAGAKLILDAINEK
jgi:hypothetical protein